MELWHKHIDTIFMDIQNADTHVKVWHLRPYPEDAKKSTKQADFEFKEAFSFESMVQRIEVVDKILAKCVAL
jgi:hypothetical protein